ncbi:MAG: hypothetical protein QXL86_01885 [Candidatus Aenigmatarchaeota archaeon]
MKARIFKKEPEKRFDLEKLISQLYDNIYEFRRGKKNSNEFKYNIEFLIAFDRKNMEIVNKVRDSLYKIFTPYFLGRKKSGRQEIPLQVSLEADEKNLFLPISFKSSYTGSFNRFVKNMTTEISALLLPEDLSWNVENKLKLSISMVNIEKVIYNSSIPETDRFSAFDMRVDKKRLLEYYSKPIVQEVIKKFCKDRYVRIKWAKGCEKPKMRMWLKYKKELLPPPEKHEDFVKYVNEYNMMQIYTSVDRREENFPSIFVIETDIGDMLKIIDLKLAHTLSFEIISKILNFFNNYGIECCVHLSGNRSFHLWTSGLEKITKSYEEILNSMDIEDEKLNSVYGNLRILGKAVVTHLVRKMPYRIRKKFTIERENALSRNYKILVDILSSEKCAVGCPLSLHTSSGLVYTRPSVKGLSYYFRKYENYRKWCEPNFAAGYAEKYPQIYSEIVPLVGREKFEKMSEDLKKEIILVLHTSKKDPNVTPDYSFFVPDYQLEKICRRYLN